MADSDSKSDRTSAFNRRVQYFVSVIQELCASPGDSEKYKLARESYVCATPAERSAICKTMGVSPSDLAKMLDLHRAKEIKFYVWCKSLGVSEDEVPGAAQYIRDNYDKMDSTEMAFLQSLLDPTGGESEILAQMLQQ